MTAFLRRQGSGLTLLLLALLPRILNLDDFVTHDEAYHWIERTVRFAEALGEHRWEDTYQTGHPGVTTMYLGSFGLWLRALMTNVTPDSPTLLQQLAWMRGPLAIVHTLVILLSWWICCSVPLLARQTAFFAAILWATSPMLIAHARLLHLDALLTDFVTLALLCTLAACRATHPIRWVVATGIAAGLAILTKGPALILLPTIGLLMLWRCPARTWSERLGTAARYTFLWLGVAGLMVFVLWPALWVDLPGTLHRYAEQILWEGNHPYTRAQFFFGRPVTDPGIWFYPVVLLFRATPITLGGVFLLMFLWRNVEQQNRTTSLTLLLVLLIWGGIMTAGEKKYDRYLLPIWPALLILSACGWSALSETVLRQYPHRRWLWRVGVAGVGGAVFYPVLWYMPYYLSYYNPLLGGGAVAQRVLLVGWGEGVDQVGAYLRNRPDHGIILANDSRLLEPFVDVPVREISDWRETPARYAVFLLPSLQRNVDPESYAAIRQKVSTPIHRVVLHGIEYASIYHLPYPFTIPLQACFGKPLPTTTDTRNMLCLHGFTIAEEEHTITVLPSWGVEQQPDRDYWVFLHLVDPHGKVVAQIDTSPAGSHLPPTSQWQPGEQVSVPLPLPLPAPRPRGVHFLTMGVYDPQTGERLVLQGPAAADPAVAGPHALLLHTIVLTSTLRGGG